MGEIALGQFYPSNSILHKLDPRVKFIGTIVYIVSLFLVNTWIGYLFCAGFLIVMVIPKLGKPSMVTFLKPLALNYNRRKRICRKKMFFSR